MREIVGTLPHADRFFIPENWRENSNVYATDKSSGIFQTNVSRRKSEEAILVVRYEGERYHTWIPNVVDFTPFNPAGISVSSFNCFPVQYRDKNFFAEIDSAGKLVRLGPRFSDFVMECKTETGASMIGSVQHPRNDSPGLLPMYKLPHNPPLGEEKLHLIVFNNEESGYTIARQASLLGTSLFSAFQCHIVNNHIVFPDYGSMPKAEVACFPLNQFLENGKLECSARIPFELSDVENDNYEPISGADSDYVYFLSANGFLRRVRVQ